MGYLVCPVGHDPERLVGDVLELAEALDASAGFISVEPSYGLAHRIAAGVSLPKERDGLSSLRRLGRRARDWKSEQLATKIPTVEWGTFLGRAHLAQLDLDRIRAPGAFARVVSTPAMAYLQVTEDPLDDLSGELETRLPKAREALQTLLMDLGDVNLE